MRMLSIRAAPVAKASCHPSPPSPIRRRREALKRLGNIAAKLVFTGPSVPVARWRSRHDLSWFHPVSSLWPRSGLLGLGLLQPNRSGAVARMCGRGGTVQGPGIHRTWL